MDRRDFLKHVAVLPMMPLLGRVRKSEPNQDSDNANVIILVFDSLSASHLALHGYRRKTTPNLARFAKCAVVYHNHYAGGNFTTSGTASLLTGTYPWTHRALHSAGRMSEVFEQKNIFNLLNSRYNTIAFPHNVFAHLILSQMYESINLYLDPQTFSLFDDMFYTQFLSRGQDIALRAMEELLFPDNRLPGALFLALVNEIRTLVSREFNRRRFEQRYPRGIPYLSHYQTYFLVEDIVRGASDVLSEAQQPLFAYLHFFPPHMPYLPRAEFVDSFHDGWKPVTKATHFFTQGHSQKSLNEYRRSYDEYVAHLDAEFGRMLDSFRRNHLLGNSYVVITSDHGELFERGVVGHSTPLLYEPIVHIPLLIAKPGQKERKDVHSPTSCVDLLPTFLHLTGRPIPKWCEGEVLPELGGESDPERTIFAIEAKKNAMKRPLTTATVAMIRGTYKLLHYFGYPGYENEYELYDLDKDPEELQNLYSPTDPIATDLQSQLEEKLQEVNQPYHA